MPGTVIVPSGFNVGVGAPGAAPGVTTTLVIVTLLPVAEAVVPSGFTISSLFKILGVVLVPVCVTVRFSGRIIGDG